MIDQKEIQAALATNDWFQNPHTPGEFEKHGVQDKDVEFGLCLTALQTLAAAYKSLYKSLHQIAVQTTEREDANLLG